MYSNILCKASLNTTGCCCAQKLQPSFHQLLTCRLDWLSQAIFRQDTTITAGSSLTCMQYADWIVEIRPYLEKEPQELTSMFPMHKHIPKSCNPNPSLEAHDSCTVHNLAWEKTTNSETAIFEIGHRKPHSQPSFQLVKKFQYQFTDHSGLQEIRCVR